ncbi:hypothetical protein GCM10009760_39730 [Kitasatospora kazusensis]|uniref:Secreted protein n=1 Tax=Kitasatospora kazusensis TaxID=407974 RepID=A0ABN2ZUY0_9ACTN
MVPITVNVCFCGGWWHSGASAAAAAGVAATIGRPPTMAAPAAVAAERVTKSRRFKGMDDSNVGREDEASTRNK